MSVQNKIHRIIYILLAVSLLYFLLPGDIWAIDGGSEITVSSIEELKVALSSEQTTTIKLNEYGSIYSTSETISIPANKTVDLNGQTVTGTLEYAFDLTGENANLTNGTIKNSGVRVTGNNGSGSISGLTINNAPDYGIVVRSSGTIGSIRNNTINSPSGTGINIQSGIVTGDISGNTVSSCQDTSHGSIYLFSGAKVAGSISGNTIKNGKSHGIHFYSKSSSGNISNNTITGVSDRAILLTGRGKEAKSNDGSSCGDITGNKISSCKGHGISIYHGSRVGHIKGNTLKNIGGRNDKSIGDYAITVNSGTPFETYAKSITNNTIDSVRYAGIVVFSGPEGDTTGKWQDKGHVKGDIAYNTVSNSGTYKKNIDFDKKTKVACQGAIYVDSHARVYGDIHDNIVNTSYDDGINILAYSKVRSVFNNKVNNVGNCGIALKNHSVVSGDVYGNTVTNPRYQGLFLNNKSSVKGKITKNTISKSGRNGIFLSDSNAGTIISNNITGAKLYGVIAAGGSSTINLLKSNKISLDNAKTGMAILSNTKSAIVTITGNKITGKYSRGIRVKYPTKKMTIKSNTMKTSSPKKYKSIGISVEGTKKKTIKILSNKITGNNNGSGIYLTKSSAKVKGNKISKTRSKVSVVKSKYKVIS